MASTCFVLTAYIFFAEHILADHEVHKFMGKAFAPALLESRPMRSPVMASGLQEFGEVQSRSGGTGAHTASIIWGPLRNVEQDAAQIKEKTIVLKTELQKLRSQIENVDVFQNQKQGRIAAVQSSLLQDLRLLTSLAVVGAVAALLFSVTGRLRVRRNHISTVNVGVSQLADVQMAIAGGAAVGHRSGAPTMVEGHSCHRLAFFHRKLLVGKKFKAASPNGRFSDGAATINDKVLQRIEVHGKNMFYFFEGDVVVHMHFGMSGRFSVHSFANAPTPGATTRLRLENLDSDVIAHASAQRLDLMENLGEYDRKIQTLGPDPLREDADKELLWAKWRKTSRAVGLVLMDQSLVAGIGNIFRAEILFKAGVHPEQPANTISRESFDRVWQHSVGCLQAGFQYGSIITVDPHEAKSLGEKWQRRYIYNQDSCGRCGSVVLSWKMATRKVYCCPVCQALSPGTELPEKRQEVLRKAWGVHPSSSPHANHCLGESRTLQHRHGKSKTNSPQPGTAHVSNKVVSVAGAAREKVLAGETRSVEHVAEMDDEVASALAHDQNTPAKRRPGQLTNGGGSVASTPRKNALPQTNRAAVPPDHIGGDGAPALSMPARSKQDAPTPPSGEPGSFDAPVPEVENIDCRRCRRLNDCPLSDEAGPVLYWMSRDQRCHDNWGLLYAQGLALKWSVPLHVVFSLVPKFSNATIRQYDFLLRGLREVEADLRECGIAFHLRMGVPNTQIPSLCNELKARIIVCDMSPLRIPVQWGKDVAHACQAKGVPVVQVDAHNIVPLWVASDKQEYAARTIRKKIMLPMSTYLTDFPALQRHPHQPKKEAWPAPVDWDAAEASLEVDRSVKPVENISPGMTAGQKQLEEFIEKRLSSFASQRNNPNADALSGLSPWIHFGQISVQRCVLQVQQAVHAEGSSLTMRESCDAFIEESVVRRELSDNFCFYNENYDRIEGAAGWAQTTLKDHERDNREYIYSMQQLQDGKTHDDLWNASQLQMVRDGKMHGFLRMYWAKKILEWSPTPNEALERAIYLNDRFQLDGRDPNGYVGCMWSICGVHDRAWAEREIFGKIRFMNYSGCKRKFDVPGFVSRFPGAVVADTSAAPFKKQRLN